MFCRKWHHDQEKDPANEYQCTIPVESAFLLATMTLSVLYEREMFGEKFPMTQMPKMATTRPEDEVAHELDIFDQGLGQLDFRAPRASCQHEPG
jgi:hypothetical protein